MFIKSPLSHKKEVAVLCDAGARELFCGIEPFAWRGKFKDFSINQRAIGANFTKLSDLKKAVQTAHEYKTKVHVAMNAFFYLEEQYKVAGKIVQDILEIGVDGIIVADPGLLITLDRNLLKGKDVILGCDAVVFNGSAVQLYKKLGATRIVFPRSITISEMSEIVIADNSLEYEAFIIHDLCFFEDGFCAYCKEQAGGVKKEGRGNKGVQFFTTSRLPARGFGGGCRTPFKRQRIFFKNNGKSEKIKPFSFWGKKHIQGCGACAIYDFNRMGIANLKVLDRNLPTEEKVRAVSFIKKCVNLLNEPGINRKDYLEKSRDLFQQVFKVKCNKYDCYYPSVFN